MIVRKVVTSLIIIGLAAEVWSHVDMETEDFYFPLEPIINYCLFADQCLHDYITICGQDNLGITRMFVDLCDLNEYNCDEKKQYRHVTMNTCKYELGAAP
ncbi:unnamed protein product [Spodoptera littoralis]|uniref:Uncharacterized protein n=1 Tax=Spodoptera littoralis TaxID=7109 RepID=A0A9P0HY13_SPOLI|nr:unnamed protein product [Spodoptera littoralis]CAH1635987.1 unnamed protein product [Spodoptera littoralis]